ncbi:adenylate/guanylate cyclase domain-containing protein [Bradyrhizobium erythrophlei]|uniref:adenylate/guanylate cyclase domain-containing protein n=1 Tax=Bradyrhizobium erythrophlei TaxID=1437360 RepID=UPI0035EA160A
MGEQHVERRLAAILAADVAGYSRLMGANEVGTLRALKTLQKEVVQPPLTAHGGRVVKLTGDGILIEFASAVDAVAYAVEVQRAMARRNAPLPPDRRIDYRVGVNIGDVIVDGEDIYGDGVNVAARLEALAEPGGVCISGAVYEHVRDKLPFAFADKGEQTVKNIARPVHVYALDADAVAALGGMEPSLAQPGPLRWWNLRRKWLALAGVAATLLLAAGVWTTFRPAPAPQGPPSVPGLSIVVLPFTNLSGDPAQDYLADAVTDELTTALSRLRGAFVIARSTAFTYKGKPIDVKQIGRELGVRYVLEGSEQSSGDRVRFNAQLISAETGAHLWADKFDAGRADLLTMADEVVMRLARSLEIETNAIEAARVARAVQGNLDAEDLALRCQAGFDTSTVGSAERAAAFDLCDRALQIDGRNVIALNILAAKYIFGLINGLSADREADIQRAAELVARALAIEPNNYRAHAYKAFLLSVQKRHEEALIEAERSLALNPSFIPAYSPLCGANWALGRPEKIIECADTANRLSPRDPTLNVFFLWKGIAYSMLKESAQAIDMYRRCLAMVPQHPVGLRLLAAELALNGQLPEARDTLQRYFSLKDFGIRTVAQEEAVYGESFSDNPTYRDWLRRLKDGLRQAGMPEE